jgi:hypothetical protein
MLKSLGNCYEFRTPDQDPVRLVGAAWPGKIPVLMLSMAVKVKAYRTDGRHISARRAALGLNQSGEVFLPVPLRNQNINATHPDSVSLGLRRGAHPRPFKITNDISVCSAPC